MRLWSVHPKYLDRLGLTALWREGLLGQAVLEGKTRGYTRHPQLERFRASSMPARCIAEYLRPVQKEAARRGYNFNADKIGRGRYPRRLPLRRGQLLYEWAHLKAKLAARAPACFAKLKGIKVPEAHPLFRVVAGSVEPWEKTKRIPAANARPRRNATK